jgi:hypothetical protein
MNIDFYSFGNMVIEGKSFDSDLIIFPEKVDSSWWRKMGHRVELEDLTAVLAASPEVLIIGTGYMGLMKVPEELRKELIKKNIELYIEDSRQAVELFNSIHTIRRTIAAFHLTC